MQGAYYSVYENSFASTPNQESAHPWAHPNGPLQTVFFFKFCFHPRFSMKTVCVNVAIGRDNIKRQPHGSFFNRERKLPRRHIFFYFFFFVDDGRRKHSPSFVAVPVMPTAMQYGIVWKTPMRCVKWDSVKWIDFLLHILCCDKIAWAGGEQSQRIKWCEPISWKKEYKVATIIEYYNYEKRSATGWFRFWKQLWKYWFEAVFLKEYYCQKY